MELSLGAKYFVALLYQTESLWADGEQLSSVCGASAVCGTDIWRSEAASVPVNEPLQPCGDAQASCNQEPFWKNKNHKLFPYIRLDTEYQRFSPVKLPEILI